MGSEHFFFPFFWKDFLASTSTWTDEQVGAYLRLLMWAWDREGLPADEASVQRLGGWKRGAWRRIWSVVGEKWVLREGRLVNLRQEEIRRKVQGRSAAAAASADARWGKERSQDSGNAPEMRTHPPRNARQSKTQRDHLPPTPSAERKGRLTRAERKAALRAVGPSVGAWRDECACAGHQPPCSTPERHRVVTALIAKAEHPEDVPA